MSLKDNFYQAVKELLNHGGLVGSDMEEQAKNQSELDSYLDKPAATAEFNTAFESAFKDAAPQPAPAMGGFASSAATRQPNMGAAPPPASGPVEAEVPLFGSQAASAGAGRGPGRTMTMAQPRMNSSSDGDSTTSSSEMTIISKNTIIDGSVRSFASIIIEGNIKGNVDVTKDAHISGKVVGDIKCNDVVMVGSAVQGNIVTKGHLILDGDSLLLGDVSAQQAEINGKVRGNIAVSGRTEFRSDAVILGDIKTSAIVIMDGANIQGYVDTSYIAENAERVFPGGVSIDEA